MSRSTPVLFALLLVAGSAGFVRPAFAQAPAAVSLSPEDVHAKAGIKCEGCHTKTGPEQFSAVDPTKVAAMCGQCHVREAELFLQSPKKAIFETLQMPQCITCHTNHDVKQPTDAMVGLESETCSLCHTPDAKSADTIKHLRGGLDQVAGAIGAATSLVGRAEAAGMLVEDAHAELRAAREQQVLARLSLHAFAPGPMDAPVKAGVAATSHATALANDALAELKRRRQGLAVATLLILGFLATLWIKIRRLPPF